MNWGQRKGVAPSSYIYLSTEGFRAPGVGGEDARGEDGEA